MWYTYNTLRKTKIVSGRSGGRLVWATSISQYTQLLSTRYTAFSQWTNLDPIRAYRLIRVYHEVVSFSCKSEGKASLSFKISRRYFTDAQLYWLMPRIEEDVPPPPPSFSRRSWWMFEKRWKLMEKKVLLYQRTRWSCPLWLVAPPLRRSRLWWGNDLRTWSEMDKLIQTSWSVENDNDDRELWWTPRVACSSWNRCWDPADRDEPRLLDLFVKIRAFEL